MLPINCNCKNHEVAKKFNHITGGKISHYKVSVPQHLLIDNPVSSSLYSI